MGVNDYGAATSPLDAPPLGGPGGWAESVAAVLDGSDETVDARIAAHAADTTDVHGIPDTADLTTTAELEAYAAVRATVGNLLTDNVASGTDTLGTTEGFTSVGGATLSSTTGDPLTGARSLRAQATVDTNLSFVSCPSDQTIPVVPGQTMTLRAMIKTPSHTGEQWVARMEFIGATTVVGPDVLVNNAAYTEVAWTGVVPAGATTVRWHFRRMVGVNGAVAYIDNLSLHVGAGGNWAMPGTPITGLGTRITRPNVDDRLVEQWNGSEWSVVDYDSGARNYTVSSAGTLRRSGRAVAWTGTGALPTGFRDTYAVGGQFFMTNDDTPTSLPGTLVTPAPE